MSVLIFGATGHTGKLVCEKLSLRGIDVIAAVRNAAQRDCSELKAKEIVNVDLEDDFNRLEVRPDHIVFAAGSGSKTGPDKTLSVDLNGALKTIDWASAQGVKTFTMLSSMGCEEPEALPKSLRPYLLAKAKADEHLRQSTLQHLIIKPARLTFEPAAGSISAIPQVDEFTPISREDVADIVVRLLEDVSNFNRTIELMGGETPIDDALKTIIKKEVAG